MYHIAKFNKEGQIEYLNKEGIFCNDIFSARIFNEGDKDVFKIFYNLRQKYTYEEIHFFPSKYNFPKNLPMKEGGKDRK